eukprot:g1137.t1
MEPLVFMVLKGKLELKRNRYSGSNLAFVADLDEDGLPRIGLPPPLKGSLRHKLERQYWADPTNFVPDIKDIKKSLTKEQAKVHNHKVLLKERIESTAARRRDRILKREEAAREARPLREASGACAETWAILKPGDVFGSLAFFPLWGVAEPFTVVSASPDCVVASVRGTQEHILKEVRVDFGRSLQKKLSAVVESTALEEPGEKSAAETLTAPSEVPDETPASSERAESPESESPQMSMGASRSIKSTGRLQAYFVHENDSEQHINCE